MKTTQAKREQAQSRLLARRKRSAAQQIALLSKRPGEAKRERARLAKFARAA